MKKLLLFFTLCVPMLVQAIEVTLGGIKYSIDGTEATVIANSYSGEINIPATVNYLGKTVNVTSIGSSAFYNCSGLTSVTIPNSVTSIGDGAFYNCSGLTAVNISCTDIEDFCNYVQRADIESIFYVSYRFSNSREDYRGLSNKVHNIYIAGELQKEITIPNSVTSIGYYAFYNCRGLTSITIPNSVTSIGDCAFFDCRGLTSVNITDLASWCNIDFGGFYANPTYYAHKLVLNGTEIKDLVIPEEVTKVKNYAFYKCSGLTSITIPNSVTSIGNNAFAYCSSLTSVTIPNSVTSIEISAFYGCSSLTSITIPNSVTSIGSSAFKNCSGLISITIPNSVTSMEDSAFEGCSGLTTVNVSCTDMEDFCKYIQRTDILSIYHAGGLSGKTHNLYIAGTLQKDINIPNSVTSIGEHAFDRCLELVSIYIPNSVARIESCAFWGCTSLTSITIPNSVTSIGSSAFDSCSGLTSITIPNSVTSIGSSAFYNCSGLTSITIPNSVTSIGGYAFSSCSSLTSITIPNSVTSIGSYAFSSCSSLTSVTIPNSVTSIGGYAFSSCSNLTSILCDRQVPPTLSNDIVSDYSMCTLYVSREFVNSYKKAEIWSKFTKIYPFEAYEWQKLLSECKAIYDANSSEYKLGNALISDPNSFSTNANETREGDITKLIDGDCKTYWHSNWSKTVAPHTHYLQIALPEAIGGTIMMKMGRRMTENNTIHKFDNPVKMSAEFSSDGTSFSGLTYFDTPYNQTVENPYVTATFDAPEGTKYIRLYNEQSNGSNQRGYWHCGEMQFYTTEYVVGRNERDPETSSLFGQMLQDALNRDPGQITQKDIDEFKEVYQYYLGQLGYVSNIVLDKTSATICILQTMQLSATISPENADDKSVTWSSSNPEVATVSQDGLVTSVAEGETTIICMANDGGNAVAYCNIIVETTHVSLIGLELESDWLFIGQSVRIPVTISPENADDKSVTWTSSNPEVVSVDETGLLTSLSAGEATITCRANDGGGASVSFEVYSAVFATNYRPSANATNTQRHITSIGITEQDGEPQNVNISTGKVYNDLTETAIFEVTEGSTVTANIGYYGAWMHGYFYIDLNNDHELAYNPNQIDQTDTEVFSYSFWSGDENNGESGQNSAGQTLTGNNRNSVVNNVITLPTFTAPAAGTYNVRFKVDWNCIDPAGNTTEKDNIIKDGGYIVDAVLKVNPGKATDIQGLSTSSDAQTIYDLSGRRIEVSSRGLYIQNGRKIIKH